MSLTVLGAIADDLGIVLLLLPLGYTVVEVAQRLLGVRVSLTAGERVLLAFYAAGGAFFVLESIPLPYIGWPLVVTALAVGGVGGGILAFGRRDSLGKQFRDLPSISTFAVVLVATLSLLLVEVAPVADHPFPNVWDGGQVSLWMNLMLTHHVMPWTLRPFSSAGVTYPLGSAVWMSLPVLLFGWPIVTAPLMLPPLFLALSVPAAYCWGARLGLPARVDSKVTGLVFAGFFAFTASWPRLFVGGSYDFQFALPLLMVLMGLLPQFVMGRFRSWPEVLALGLVGGVLSSLSVVAGEALCILLVGTLLAFRPVTLRELGRWLPRVIVIAGCEILGVLRSVIGNLVWWSYPSHVLTQTGSTLYTPPSIFGSFGWSLLQGELDPFVPWKPKMSPFPLLSLQLQVLVILGAAALIVLTVRGPALRRRILPPSMGRSLTTNVIVLFVATALLVLTMLPVGWLQGIGTVTSFDQVSLLAFLCLQAFATIPLVVSALWLDDWWKRRTLTSRIATSQIRRALRRAVPPVQDRSWLPRAVAVLAVLVVGIPIVSGAVLTFSSVPGLIAEDIDKTSNVTSSDVAALVWVGNHLPECAAVFVAPGSAGQFLPEYASVTIVYQMTPTPRNLSYYLVVDDLVADVYTGTTRAALLSLGVTEVFVSGQTSVSYPPLDEGRLLTSADFQVLFSQGDAAVFEFLPGVAQTGCPG